MNQHPHDYALSLGPCPNHEYDLVELQEGSLDAGRAGAVQHHITQCSRCRAYALALGELDAALVDALPRPALSPDFYGGSLNAVALKVHQRRAGDTRQHLDVAVKRPGVGHQALLLVLQHVGHLQRRPSAATSCGCGTAATPSAG